MLTGLETTAPVWAFFAVTALAVVLVGIAKAGFAGGIGIIAVPLMTFVTSPIYAAAIMLPLLLACDVIAIWHYRRLVVWPVFWKLFPGSLVGLVIASFFLWLFRDHQKRAEFLMNQVIGWSSLLFVAFHLTRVRIAREVHHHPPRNWVGHLLGLVAGFTSTLSHSGGPPVTMFLLSQRLDRRLLVGTTVWLFGTLNFIKLVPYLGLGIVNFGNLRISVLLLPFVPVGTLLGIWLNTRISATWFMRVMLVLLTLIGIQMVSGWNPISAFHK